MNWKQPGLMVDCKMVKIQEFNVGDLIKSSELDKLAIIIEIDENIEYIEYIYNIQVQWLPDNKIRWITPRYITLVSKVK